MLDLTPERLIGSLIVLAMFLLIAFPIHEFAHAFAAFQLGDGTARLMGRLTIDPRAHFDPTGALLLAISMLAFGGGIGWAKPTPYNPMNLRGGRWGEAIVSVAGPISNLVLAIAAAIPLRYMIATRMVEDVPLLAGVLFFFIQINLLLMVFNLIPIPPLDGSKVLFAFLDRRTEYQIRPILEQYGFVILLLLFFLPPGGSIGGRVLLPIIDAFYSFLVGF